MLLNSITSLLLQVTSFICGFILTKSIIGHFGSQTNGIINSIGQFLGYIVLLEAGIGGAARAASYKPLATRDYTELNKIFTVFQSFYRKLVIVFIVYICVLAFAFPYISNTIDEYWFTVVLVVIIAMSTLAQYAFGVPYQMILQSDQKNYVINTIQIVAVVLNFAFSIILIKLGFSIIVAKSVSSLIFILRPFILRHYAKRQYPLFYDKEVIKQGYKLPQRWNALGQHFAFFIRTNSSIVIITLFLTLKDVSIFSVYYVIVKSMPILNSALSNGLEPFLGSLIAMGDKKLLNKNFVLYSSLNTFLTALIFSCAAVLIIPFMGIYTSSFIDANYIIPLLGYFLIMTEAIHCLNIPYQSLTNAFGHFKQTRFGAYTEALINVALSIVLVILFKLPGLALGILVSVVFRNIYNFYYASKKLQIISLRDYLQQIIFLTLSAACIVFIGGFIPINATSYLEWVFYAIILVIIAFIICSIFFIIFYRKQLFQGLELLKKILKGFKK